MSRLIDADALKTAFDVMRYGKHGELTRWDSRSGWCVSGDEVEKLIDSAPTVDAVQVVRCRDCKHGTLCRSKDGRESVQCDAFDNPDVPFVILGADCYCDMGERRGDCGTDYCELE